MGDFVDDADIQFFQVMIFFFYSDYFFTSLTAVKCMNAVNNKIKKMIQRMYDQVKYL